MPVCKCTWLHVQVKYIGVYKSSAVPQLPWSMVQRLALLATHMPWLQCLPFLQACHEETAHQILHNEHSVKQSGHD